MVPDTTTALTITLLNLMSLHASIVLLEYWGGKPLSVPVPFIDDDVAPGNLGQSRPITFAHQELIGGQHHLNLRVAATPALNLHDHTQIQAGPW